MSDLRKIKENFTSIVLCAGEGVRAKSIANNVPKSLFKIKSFHNQPILYLIIDSLVILKLDPVVIVTGHLGDQIEDFINSPQIKNQFGDATILTNSSGSRYKLGPLHSFLSITTNPRIFKEDNIFLIFPGDTFFDIRILKDILDLLITNFSQISRNSLIFYRKIRADVLKNRFKNYYPKQEITISYLKIEKKGFESTHKEISQKQLKLFSNEEYINQIMPIFIFNYDHVKKIQELVKSIKISYLREAVNLMIKKNMSFLTFSVNPNRDFYDIDTLLDLKILNEKKKSGQ